MTDTNGDMPYRFEILPLKQLIVDTYQRKLTSFVEKIADPDTYDPALIGTLITSERSKTKFAIIDGQTRAEGMKRAKRTEAPCLVFEHLTVAQEADLFARFQLERRGMHSTDRFNAQLVAGHGDAVEIQEIVKGAGFTVGNEGIHGEIGAIAAVEYAYYGASAAKKARLPDPVLLADTLTVIKEAWPDAPDGARSALIIKGVSRFLKDNPDVNMERLVQRLSRVQPSVLAKRAQALKEGKGMITNSPRFTAEAIEAQAAKQIRA